MRIAIILALLLVGVVIAVVSYVVAVRRRAKRKSVSEGKNELRQDKAQPTVECEPSVQTQVSEKVQPQPKVPSVKVESKLPDAPEVARPLGERPEAAAEAGLTVLPQPGVPEPPEAGPGVTEKEKRREVEPTSEVQPTQAVTETHTEKPREGAEGPKPMTAAKNASASTTDPTNNRTEEASPEKGKRPVQDAKRISPEKRGGRSRAAVEQSEEKQTSNGRPRTPKPEIVCWKREREWVLAVEIPEELHTSVGLSKRHAFDRGRIRERLLATGNTWRGSGRVHSGK